MSKTITDLEPIEPVTSATQKKRRGGKRPTRRGNGRSLMKIKFTEEWCARLTPQATILTFWDDSCPGLALRLYPRGNRVFYAFARRSWAPNPVWRHLGCWPEMTVKGARLAAHTMVEAIRHEAPPKPKGAMIVDLIERYIQEHLLALNPKTSRPKLRTGCRFEKRLRRIVIPA
jgi:hypothetical protein